jgi:MraZ protein
MGYMMKINKLNRFVKKNNDFIRRFTAGVKVVDDSLGRVLIPKDLISFGSITKSRFFFRCQHMWKFGIKTYETSINGRRRFCRFRRGNGKYK